MNPVHSNSSTPQQLPPASVHHAKHSGQTHARALHHGAPPKVESKNEKTETPAVKQNALEQTALPRKTTAGTELPNKGKMMHDEVSKDENSIPGAEIAKLDFDPTDYGGSPFGGSTRVFPENGNLW